MPVSGKTKQSVVSEFRCAEIVEAARKIFAKKGFESATMDDIAEAAGLAKGTLYLYFPSKREVYLAALKQGWIRLIEATGRSLQAAATPADKIRAFITTRVRHAEENRDFVRIYHAEFGNIGPPHLGKEFRNLYLQQAKALETVLSEAVKAGQIRPVREHAAALVIYEMTRGLIMQRLLGWSREPAEKDIDFLFEMIWKGLAG